MIRVEVTSEADVTRMTAAFQGLPALRDLDYEIWLGSALNGGTMVRRAWRKDGLRGGTGTNTVIIYAGDPPLPGGGGGGSASFGEVNASGGPGLPCMTGGTCATCGNPVPGGGHTEDCTGLVPGSEYLIGGGGAYDGETGKGAN